jgi:DNA polymerase III epsilon subunit-like protein
MVDLETLGTSPGSVILSLAAVTFATPFAIEPFYVRISKESCIDSAFTVDARTVEWWEKQSPEARNIAFSGTMDVIVAMAKFAEYCRQLPTAPLIWGNGADFDNALLAEAYRRVGITVPWKYCNSRCYRTLKNLFSQIPFVQPALKHDALQDALAQAKHSEAIFAFIAERGGHAS